jgi:hypothetical protein
MSEERMMVLRMLKEDKITSKLDLKGSPLYFILAGLGSGGDFRIVPPKRWNIRKFSV